ncbi:hypothetical protein RhiirA5_424736 [Rhizophagus irregularis]|uniref:CCHC-type domain-containing protein n=1 Tax=Rhizophagus irregularis TaxID=588596 RepID=A0A2N0P7H5_9GLOM|nr:hypothetical protein RhiirA5_424736 [Rhizophagus irregularis]
MQALDKEQLDNNSLPSNNMDNTEFSSPHALSSEHDISSHDISNEKRDAPITNEQDAMSIDHPDELLDQNKTNTANPNTDGSAAINNSTRAITTYEVFIPRDSFNKEKSNNEILDQIKNAFVNDKSAIKFKIHTSMTYTYFVITLTSQETFIRLTTKPITNLNNIKTYELTQQNIESRAFKIFKPQDDNILRVLDVPFNYDVKLLVSHIATTTGKIIVTYKVLKKRPREIRNRFNNKKIFINPQYKLVIIKFDSNGALQYLMDKDMWGILIEDFLVRIVPGNMQCDEYKKRTSSSFLVTGIPLNANIFDLKNLITYLKGRTCTFTQTKRTSLHKNAYIYYDLNDYKDSTPVPKFSTDFNNSKLFIYKSEAHVRTCGNCGDSTHQINECPDSKFSLGHRGQKYFNKKYSISNEIINSQSVNRNNINSNNNTATTSNNARSNNNKSNFNTSKQGSTPRGSTSNSFDVKEKEVLLKRINNLEAAVRELTEMVYILKESKDSTKKDIAINTHNITSLNKKFELDEEYSSTSKNISLILEKLSNNSSSNDTQIRTHKHNTRHNPYGQSSYQQTKNRHIPQHEEVVYENDNVMEEQDETYAEHEYDSTYKTEQVNEVIHPNLNNSTPKRSFLVLEY